MVSPKWDAVCYRILRDKKMVLGVCRLRKPPNTILTITFGSLFTTTVFKGEVYPGTIRHHFAVFNFHVQLGNLCNS